jgi:hypothetical protein
MVLLSSMHDPIPQYSPVLGYNSSKFELSQMSAVQMLAHLYPDASDPEIKRHTSAFFNKAAAALNKSVPLSPAQMLAKNRTCKLRYWLRTPHEALIARYTEALEPLRFGYSQSLSIDNLGVFDMSPSPWGFVEWYQTTQYNLSFTINDLPILSSWNNVLCHLGDQIQNRWSAKLSVVKNEVVISYAFDSTDGCLFRIGS